MSVSTIDERLAGVDDLIVGAMNEHTLAGLGVGIVRGGRLVYAKGFGLADAATRRPVTPATLFRIGSISKTITAVAVMQLWEQERLDLDRPVAPAGQIQYGESGFRTSGTGDRRRLHDRSTCCPVSGQPDRARPGHRR